MINELEVSVRPLQGIENKIQAILASNLDLWRWREP